MSFGNSKIIPNLNKDKLQLLIQSSNAHKQNPTEVNSILEKVIDDVFNLVGNVKLLGLGTKGITTYFSSNCTEDDAKLVAEYLQEKRLDAYNTRCFKT